MLTCSPVDPVLPGFIEIINGKYYVENRKKKLRNIRITDRLEVMRHYCLFESEHLQTRINL